MAGLYPFQKQLLIDIKSGGIKPGEMTIMMAGRQAGKSTANWQYINHWLRTMRPHVKLSWRELPGKKLQAYVDPNRHPDNAIWGLREEDMDPVQKWSQETNCGTRMSFDIWQFKTQKQITMFLLAWTQ
jgi:hypothetical protein